MKRYLGFIAVLIMAIGLSLNVAAADTGEQVINTNLLPYNNMSGTVECQEESKASYKINVDEDNKKIQFELTSEQLDDLEMTLYDGDRTHTVANNNSKKNGVYYKGAVLQKGTYYLEITSTKIEEGQNISYNLSVKPLTELTSARVIITPREIIRIGSTITVGINENDIKSEGAYADTVTYKADNKEIVELDSISGEGKTLKAGTTKIHAFNLSGKEIGSAELTVQDMDILEENKPMTIETNSSEESILLFKPEKNQKYLFMSDVKDVQLTLYEPSLAHSVILTGYPTEAGGRKWIPMSEQLNPEKTYQLKIKSTKGGKIQLGAYTDLSKEDPDAIEFPISKDITEKNLASGFRLFGKINITSEGKYEIKITSPEYVTAQRTMIFLSKQDYSTQKSVQTWPKETEGAPYIRKATYDNLPVGTYYLMINYMNPLEGKDISYKLNAFKVADNPITAITITDIPKLTVGNTHKITYKTVPETTDDVVLFESSDEAVAKVTKEGEITAVSAGKATITARNSAGDVVGSSEITVENAKVPDAASTEVKVNKLKIVGASHVLAVGKKRQLKVKATPKAANTAVVWRSSNKKYATVNKNGKVLAKRAGRGRKVVITAIAKDGSGVKATYKIRIAKGIVKKVKITGSKTAKAGKTVKLKAKVTGTKGCYKKVKWISSNEKLATVTSAGKVKFTKKAKNKKVKITAKALDGSGKKAVYNYFVR